METENLETLLSEAKSFNHAASIIIRHIFNKQDHPLTRVDRDSIDRLKAALHIWEEEIWENNKNAIKRMRWAGLVDYADAIEFDDFSKINF